MSRVEDPENSPVPNARFGVGILAAAAVGLAAIAALLFVLLTPGVRQSDTASSFSADVRQFTAALPPQPRDWQPQDRQSQDQQSQDQQASENAAGPAIAQFQRLLTSPDAPAAQAGREPADKLLRRFMQWHLKTSLAENAQ